MSKFDPVASAKIPCLEVLDPKSGNKIDDRIVFSLILSQCLHIVYIIDVNNREFSSLIISFALRLAKGNFYFATSEKKNLIERETL